MLFPLRFLMNWRLVRAAINYGNPVLAQQGRDGSPQGVSVALAKALAQELGAQLEMITFDAAGKVFAALEEGVWNIAFLAIEPVREQQIAFSEPYVIIEGTYLVAADSAYTAVDDLDRLFADAHLQAVSSSTSYFSKMMVRRRAA